MRGHSNAMVRPKKPDGERRDIVVKLRLTEQEAERFSATAERMGCTVSEMIRRLVEKEARRRR